jgi:hypothetical protein
MTADLFLAQLVGLVATAFSVSSVAMKCDRRLRLTAATGQATWTLHFWLLGAPTTAAICALTCTRQLSSLVTSRFPARVQAWLTGLFYAAFTGAALVTWEGWMSLLPWACAMLANFAYSSLHGTTMRKALRGVDGIAFANGCLVGSIGAVLTSTFSIVLNTITILKLEGRVTSLRGLLRARLLRLQLLAR